MIKSLRIQNFQSHKDTFIEFGPGVNVLVGPSENGKSAVLRNMFWNLFNKPGGDDFQSHWGGDVRSDIEFSDGTLTRLKTKSFNGYILGDEEYKGMGQKVPEPISAFSNMTSLNFQRQLDPPFMLSWTSGERGIFLNKIANLDVIDSSITNIKRTVSETGQDIEIVKTNLKEDKKELAASIDTRDLEERIGVLEKFQTRSGDLRKKEEDLKEILYDIRAWGQTLADCEPILKMESRIINLEKMETELKEIRKGSGSLGALLDDIEDEEEKIQTLVSQLEKLEARFAIEMPSQCPLCGEGK